MSYIDFSNIPKIRESISEQEIQKLNELFQAPQIVEQLKEIEKNRIKRRGKVFITLFIACFLIIIFFGFASHLETLKVHDTTFAGILGFISFGFFFFLAGRQFFIKKKYESLIEQPLQQNIITKIGSILHPSFQYSRDKRFAFHEFDILKDKKFFNFQKQDPVKDSIEFSIEQNGVSFRVNGCSAYEFLKFSGQKHATLFYVTKIVFPQARIPLQTDVLVTSENVDTIKPRYFQIGVIAAAMIYLPYLVYDGLPEGSYNGIEGKDVTTLLAIICGVIFFTFLGTVILRWIQHKKVSLENIDFEKLFNVYSDDQISSRMILTPSIMQRLVDYNKKTGNYHSFLFTKDTVYIKMMISRNYMQVDTRKNILQNAQSFLKVYGEMRQLLTLAKDLNFFYLSKTIEQHNTEIKTEIL